MAIFSKLAESLKKTRANLAGVLGPIFSQSAINDDFYDQLEEALIVADVGYETTARVIDGLREQIKQQKVTDPQQAKGLLKDIIAGMMHSETEFLPCGGAVLVVGVNGVGKTTTIGKLANYYKQAGKNVMLAAGDTFRAAAGEQLSVWAQRAGVPLVKHGEGADPAAVVFDAAASFKAKGADVMICDTAGRLHNKKNLMEELKKIKRVLSRELPNMPIETLLVLDAPTGQNAIAQAETFKEAVDITGIVLTKLDGTAKGGVVLSAAARLNIPVRFVGVGEGIGDLMPFDAGQFADALF